MYTKLKRIDKILLASIYEYEEKLFQEIKAEFETPCTNISKLYGWNFVIEVKRWTDTFIKCRNVAYDGYTATLQIEFTDKYGNLIEFDESGCSFFENITFISFNPISRTYTIFQNEKLHDIRTELKRFVSRLLSPQ